MQAWINNYVDAWCSPGVAKLANIFARNVSYSVSPWSRRLNGLQELEPFWESARASYNEVFEVQSAIVAIEDRTAVAKIEVTYANDEPSQWRDLWIITFDKNGLCSSFEEWPFSFSQNDGQDV